MISLYLDGESLNPILGPSSIGKGWFRQYVYMIYVRSTLSFALSAHGC